MKLSIGGLISENVRQAVKCQTHSVFRWRDIIPFWRFGGKLTILYALFTRPLECFVIALALWNFAYMEIKIYILRLFNLSKWSSTGEIVAGTKMLMSQNGPCQEILLPSYNFLVHFYLSMVQSSNMIYSICIWSCDS